MSDERRPDTVELTFDTTVSFAIDLRTRQIGEPRYGEEIRDELDLVVLFAEGEYVTEYLGYDYLGSEDEDLIEQALRIFSGVARETT